MSIMSSVAGRGLRYQMSGAALLAAALSAGLVIFLFLIGLATDRSDLTYAGMALLAFLMPMAAGLVRGRDYDIFEPINLVAGAILFGTTLRAFYLIGSESSRVDFLMMGTNFDQVNEKLPWMLLGVAALVIGYLVMNVRAPLERIRTVREFALSRDRLWFAIGFAAFLGALGIYLYMSQFGISLTGNILAESKKRAIEITTESGDIVYGLGYEVFLGQFAEYGFVLLASAMLARLVPNTLGTISALIVLFALSSVVPFFSSSRSSIAVMLISICILGYYYGRVQLKAVIGVVAFVSLMVTGMGALRSMNQTGVASTDTVIDSVIGSGNSIDFVRTAAIMDRVPEVRGYQHGATYAGLITAVIPRSVWPEKPLTSLGAWVKGELFGKRVRKHGWPPGLIAEAHINFGVYGIIPVMFVFGGLLRIYYESCRPFLGVSLLVTSLYAFSVWRLAFGTIGLNFALGMIQALEFLVPTLVFLLLAKAPLRRETRRWTGLPSAAR